MKKTEWFKRKFELNLDPGNFPGILERLSGTPARLDEKVKIIPHKILTVQEDNKWSIQENAGHLEDLEPLWLQRMRDILEGREYMSLPDSGEGAGSRRSHNAIPIFEILKNFRIRRAQFVLALSAVSSEDLMKSALHPRLQTPMRLLDLAYFIAEHDDHHLAQMTELGKRLSAIRMYKRSETGME